jgi:hypothetical protein
VIVDDTEQGARMGLLKLDPILDGAEIIADVEFARRLDAAEDA